MDITLYELYAYSISLENLASVNYVQPLLLPSHKATNWRYLNIFELEDSALEWLYAWQIKYDRYAPVFDTPFAILRFDFINGKVGGEYLYAHQVEIVVVYSRDTSPDLLVTIPRFHNRIREESIIGEVWRKRQHKPVPR